MKFRITLLILTILIANITSCNYKVVRKDKVLNEIEGVLIMTEMVNSPVPSDYFDFFLQKKKCTSSKCLEYFFRNELNNGIQIVIDKESRNNLINYSNTLQAYFTIENRYKHFKRKVFILPVKLTYISYLKKDQPKIVSHKKCTIFYKQGTITFSYNDKFINIINISPNYSPEELYRRTKKIKNESW